MIDIDIGIVGLGRRGKQHLSSLLETDFVNIHVFTTTPPSGNEHPRVCYKSSLDELLSIQSLSGVIISSPDRLHYEHILKIAGHHIPILVEKPSVMSLSEIDALLKSGIENVWVGYDRRTIKEISDLQSLIEDGYLGKLKNVIARVFTGASASMNYTNQLLMNLGSHFIDVLQFLCGELNVIAARIESKDGRDDYGYGILTTSDGVPVNMTFHFSTPPFPDVLESDMTFFFESGVLIMKKNGFVCIDYAAGTISEQNLNYESTAKEFLEIVQGQKETKLCSLAHDRQNIKVLTDMYRLSEQLND